MGTCNLTMVISNGQTKVAQYGQWDGYPSGQGVTALKFLRETNFVEFKQKVDECRFLTHDELEDIDESNWKATHPQLSRDNGADILSMIDTGVRELANREAFLTDSLFCEYAYLINFDTQTFEVLRSGDNLLKAYDLNNLPTEEQFLIELDKLENEEND